MFFILGVQIYSFQEAIFKNHPLQLRKTKVRFLRCRCWHHIQNPVKLSGRPPEQGNDYPLDFMQNLPVSWTIRFILQPLEQSGVCPPVFFPLRIQPRVPILQELGHDIDLLTTPRVHHGHTHWRRGASKDGTRRIRPAESGPLLFGENAQRDL